jgi:hypothetical protein
LYGEIVGEKVDPEEMITPEELLMSDFYTQEALIIF